MMKTLKILANTVILSLIFSTSVVFAESTADVKNAIDQTIEQLEKAVAAFDKGEDNKAIVDMLVEAKQIQKSISTSDGKLSMIKSRAVQKLGQARTSLNDGDLKGGGESMKEALASYKELKEKYAVGH